MLDGLHAENDIEGLCLVGQSLGRRASVIHAHVAFVCVCTRCRDTLGRWVDPGDREPGPRQRFG